jgi:hypothetical protein
MAERFSSDANRQATIAVRPSIVDQRLVIVARRVSIVAERLVTVDKRVASMDERSVTMDGRLPTMARPSTSIEGRWSALFSAKGKPSHKTRFWSPGEASDASMGAVAGVSAERYLAIIGGGGFIFGGARQEDKLNSMYSSTTSCGDKGALVLHLSGTIPLDVLPAVLSALP